MYRTAVPFEVVKTRRALRRFLAGEVVADVEVRCADDAAGLNCETRIGQRLGDAEALERQFASGSDVTGEQMVAPQPKEHHNEFGRRMEFVEAEGPDPKRARRE